MTHKDKVDTENSVDTEGQQNTQGRTDLEGSAHRDRQQSEHTRLRRNRMFSGHRRLRNAEGRTDIHVKVSLVHVEDSTL